MKEHALENKLDFRFRYLPEFLQLVDLLGSDLASPQLFLLGGDFHQPGQKAAVLDERLPLRAVPIDVLQTALAGTWLSVLQQHKKTNNILMIMLLNN